MYIIFAIFKNLNYKAEQRTLQPTYKTANQPRDTISLKNNKKINNLKKREKRHI